MSTNTQKGKLTLEKISISKLSNPNVILGGGYDDGTEDRTGGPKCKANSKIMR